MRNIKKIVTLGCIAVCAAVMLCSCGNKKALASISLASPITLQLGESKEVEITGILRDGTTVTGDELDAILKRKGMHYESSSDNVASIDQNGLLTANNSGTTEISITSQNKRLTAGAVVNVVEPLQGFQAEDIVASTKSTLVPVTYTTVPEGADAGTVTISVADSEIARVDENNNIIPLKAGDTTVTIRSDKGPSSIVNLKVTQAPTELFADDLYVEIGETAKLNVYTDVKDLESGVDGTNYSYENESNLICAVSVEGDVTGIEAGDSVVKIQNEAVRCGARVYSQHGNGVQDKRVVRVYAARCGGRYRQYADFGTESLSNRAYLCRHAGTGRQADVLCDGNGA